MKSKSRPNKSKAGEPTKPRYNTRSQQKPTSRLYELVHRRDLDAALVRLKSHPLDVNWSDCMRCNGPNSCKRGSSSKYNIYKPRSDNRRGLGGYCMHQPSLLAMCMIAGRQEYLKMGCRNTNCRKVSRWGDFAIEVASRAPRMVFGLDHSVDRKKDDSTQVQFASVAHSCNILFSILAYSLLSIKQWRRLLHIAQSVHEENSLVLQVLQRPNEKLSCLPEHLVHQILPYINNILLFQDCGGNTPLLMLLANYEMCVHMRGIRGFIELVDLFLKYAPQSVHIGDKDHGNKPLHVFFSNFDRKHWTQESVKDFVNILPSGSLKIKDGDGQTILHVAAGNPLMGVEYIRMLLETEPSSLREPDNDGDYPLQCAMKSREAMAIVQNARQMFDNVGLHLGFMNREFDNHSLEEIVNFLHEAEKAAVVARIEVERAEIMVIIEEAAARANMVSGNIES